MSLSLSVLFFYLFPCPTTRPLAPCLGISPTCVVNSRCWSFCTEALLEVNGFPLLVSTCCVASAADAIYSSNEFLCFSIEHWNTDTPPLPPVGRLFCFREHTAGNEVYQRLTPPIMAIKPTPSCKQPAPFRCEVLLRPAATTASGAGTADASCETPPPSTKAAPKATVAYFFRGWADKSPPDQQREGCLLKQHVAARSATVVAGGGGGETSAGSPRRAPSPTPPPAVFSALGLVTARCKGLERLAMQEVTYVGKQLRIGRTSEGDVYVYERCAWPKDMDFGLMV